jgi:hypothetical protein
MKQHPKPLNRTGGLRHEDDETGPAKLPLWTNVSLLTPNHFSLQHHILNSKIDCFSSGKEHYYV